MNLFAGSFATIRRSSFSLEGLTGDSLTDLRALLAWIVCPKQHKLHTKDNLAKRREFHYRDIMCVPFHDENAVQMGWLVYPRGGMKEGFIIMQGECEKAGMFGANTYRRFHDRLPFRALQNFHKEYLAGKTEEVTIPGEPRE